MDGELRNEVLPGGRASRPNVFLERTSAGDRVNYAVPRGSSLRIVGVSLLSPRARLRNQRQQPNELFRFVFSWRKGGDARFCETSGERGEERAFSAKRSATRGGPRAKYETNYVLRFPTHTTTSKRQRFKLPKNSNELAGAIPPFRVVFVVRSLLRAMRSTFGHSCLLEALMWRTGIQGDYRVTTQPIDSESARWTTFAEPLPPTASWAPFVCQNELTGLASGRRFIRVCKGLGGFCD